MLVTGGPANSGSKRGLREKPRTSWRCSCGVEHKPYIASCSKCRDRRDGKA